MLILVVVEVVVGSMMNVAMTSEQLGGNVPHQNTKKAGGKDDLEISIGAANENFL